MGWSIVNDRVFHLVDWMVLINATNSQTQMWRLDHTVLLIIIKQAFYNSEILLVYYICLLIEMLTK